MAANDKNVTPVWLKWLVLGFIIYAGYLHLTGKDAGTVSTTADGQGGYVSSRPANVTDVQEVGGLSVPNDIEGAGDPAACGQTAVITVKGRRADGQALELASGEASVKVGVPAKGEPWRDAIPGMKAGGVREITLTGRAFDEESRKALKLEESDTLRAIVTLESLSPAAQPGQLAFLATDLENGAGEIARCGRTAELHLTLWNPDGTVRYSSREAGAALSTIIGSASQFYGLDRTLLNMRAGGIRRAVIPPAYLAVPEAVASPALDFPRDQVLIADVQLLTVTDVK